MIASFQLLIISTLKLRPYILYPTKKHQSIYMRIFSIMKMINPFLFSCVFQYLFGLTFVVPRFNYVFADKSLPCMCLVYVTYVFMQKKLLQVLLGLLSVWNVTFLGYPARVCLWAVPVMPRLLINDNGITASYSFFFSFFSRPFYLTPKHWRNLHHIFSRHVPMTL